MERILMLLLVGALTVYCKPFEENDELQKYANEIVALTKRVEDIKDEFTKKEKDTKTPESLEDSLEAAIAEDSKIDSAKKEVKKDAKKLETKKDKRVVSEIVVPSLNDDLSEEDIIKMDMEEGRPSKEDIIKMDLEEGRPSKDDTEAETDAAEEFAHLPFLDEDMEDIFEDKKAKEDFKEDIFEDEKTKKDLKHEKREEISFLKDAVKGIKTQMHQIARDFTEVKGVYMATVKDQPLDEKASDKFKTVKRDIEGVNNGIHDLFTQFHSIKEMEDESLSEIPNDDTYAVISVVKEQLKGASDAIRDLKDMAAIQTKREVRTKSMGVGTAPHVEASKPSKDVKISKDTETKAEMGVGEALHIEEDSVTSKDAKISKDTGTTGVGKALHVEASKPSNDVKSSKDTETVKAETAVGEALHIEEDSETSKDVKEKEEYSDMEELNSLRNKVKDIIHAMKDIKERIDERKSKN